MNFNELKSGYTLFFFDRETLEYSENKILSVSLPRYENKINTVPQMVIDITVEQKATPKTYVVPENSSCVYANSLILSTDKSRILSEIKLIKSASETSLAEIEKHKSTVLKCDELLSQIDTEFKERRESEERMNNIENNVIALSADLKSLTEMMTQLINKSQLK